MTVSIMNEALKARIDEAIEEEQPIKIKAYGILPKTETGMSYITESILTKYDQIDLLGAVYTAVKELAVNGAKANLKSVLFDEMNIGLSDDEEYEHGMQYFRDHMSEDWVYEYSLKARDKDLHVDIVFDYNESRLIIEVINNRAISRREDERIREKFQRAMGYDDIAQFYLEGGDASEGAGMGIVLVTMMLKAEGIDPHLFTIRSNYRDTTIAKIEIPLAEHYTTSRERHEAS